MVPGVSAAQPTNADIIGRLACDCVHSLTALKDTVALEPDQRYDFVRTEVVAGLQEAGVVVLVSQASFVTTDSVRSPREIAGLRYRLESSAIEYAKSGADLRRTVTIGVRLLQTSGTGEVLTDSLCTRSFGDQISPEDVDAVEDPGYDITRGDRPRAGWFKRIAEPAVVAAASAVVVYLFFNVRSDRNEAP